MGGAGPIAVKGGRASWPPRRSQRIDLGGAVLGNWPCSAAAARPAGPSVEECRTGGRRPDGPTAARGVINSTRPSSTLRREWAALSAGTVLFSGATQAGCGFAEAQRRGPSTARLTPDLLDLTYPGATGCDTQGRGGPSPRPTSWPTRVRPPHPEPAGILRSAGGGTGAQQRRSAGAAGGLPGRHLGPQRHGYGLSAAPPRRTSGLP